LKLRDFDEPQIIVMRISGSDSIRGSWIRFGTFIAACIEKWAKVTKFSGPKIY